MTADPEPSMPPLIPPGGSVKFFPSTSRRPSASFYPLIKFKAFKTLLLALPLVCLACSFTHGGQFKVVRVADGDTITILQKGQKVRVRLVGIDAPETSRSKRKAGQPYSQKSKKHLAGMVLNKSVSVKSYGQDRYGRILGEVFLNGANANLEMVAVGLAEVYRGRAPKGMDTQMYWQAEKAAREAGRNIWSLRGKYVSPKEWRRRK